ncbi:hypothetical protein GLAREA_05937 [Glarea lozoyensis ATCC 20868]|uniref:Uncharacterized protein n=1 Tax=Glarea lozoyensis (strain ATCC 20868 / MF5171) TaxID=1116229 RepID=S3D572_GLAL2|nr:uncharacterized protein GLAREA_05937 [Glarea lozoyensis ATCC 20868]EPE32925.1 hypothetical protein GLAREA_05937 [Glarea lozoyensis ATCC 20868]
MNVGCGKGKKASVSVWRMKKSTSVDGEGEGEVEQFVSNQLFRDSDCNLIISASLTLFLRDFALDELTHSLPDIPIELTSQTLSGDAAMWVQDAGDGKPFDIE